MAFIDDSELTKPFIMPLCLVCDRVHNPEAPSTCDAFPMGIPTAILTGEFVHTKAMDGDRGLLFKPFTKEAKR